VAISEGFFSTSAQVLPGMAITLLVEHQLFLMSRSGRRPRSATEHTAYRRTLLSISCGLILTVIGEASALRALLWTPTNLDGVYPVIGSGALSVVVLSEEDAVA
jgi:hypothetical protein